MNDNMITCSRCGAEMRADSRYCMKCGNLNYDHPSNKGMEKFASKESQNQYVVGGGGFLGETSGDTVIQSIGNKMGNQLICFLINYLVYLLLLFGITYPLVKDGFDIDILASSYYPIMLLGVSYISLFMYSIQSLYMKANKRWWYVFIPVYNFMILAEIAFSNKIIGLLMLIPGVNVILLFIMLYKIGEKFKFNGWFSAIGFFIVIPLIGIGNNAYEGRSFVDVNEKNSMEKQYSRRKIFLITFIIMVVISIGLFVYTNVYKIVVTADKVDDKYYVYVAKRIVKYTSSAVQTNVYDCDEEFEDRYYNKQKTYYFYYDDVANYAYLPFSKAKGPVEAYVKVDINKGFNTYYVSITDGNKGFPEMEISEVNSDKVIEYTSLSDVYRSGIQCSTR